ncbi:succinate dehydrogenase assembly factor 4 [Reyranella sp. CPCC 100927]|uniref:succinate dehydrogenase assembly factor 4 n=1 Tax=Reyranella sp. CPCC 100927 TaxID=2599616 RepID=UPI0011B7FBCD|nr:succinate dehydrogenase assembly factor 4 [Reyranella sp. CPCC 100927]TWS99645.1 DUF1674 domain-containing protein [Reyranella sp. CPCC 100927]
MGVTSQTPLPTAENTAGDRATPATAQPQLTASPTPPRPTEIGGPPGPEPTRYGDWQFNGRVTDF